MSTEVFKIQDLAINKYVTNFSIDIFHKIISKDNTYLKMLNRMIEKYWGRSIQIYLKPRSWNPKTNRWIINV